MIKQLDIELTGLHHDDGYGIQDIDVSAEVECEIRIEDASFDHAFGTRYATEQYIHSIKIQEYTIWYIDRDGGVFKEQTYKQGENKDIEEKIILEAKLQLERNLYAGI